MFVADVLKARGPRGGCVRSKSQVLLAVCFSATVALVARPVVSVCFSAFRADTAAVGAGPRTNRRAAAARRRAVAVRWRGAQRSVPGGPRRALSSALLCGEAAQRRHGDAGAAGRGFGRGGSSDRDSLHRAASRGAHAARQVRRRHLRLRCTRCAHVTRRSCGPVGWRSAIRCACCSPNVACRARLLTRCANPGCSLAPRALRGCRVRRVRAPSHA